MKIIFPLIALPFFLAAGISRADFTFACGENREKGAEKAEIGFVDSFDAPMKLFFAGTAEDYAEVNIRASTKGRWFVSLQEGTAKGTQQFVFVEGEPASVQEIRISESGAVTKGATKACIFERKKVE